MARGHKHEHGSRDVASHDTPSPTAPESHAKTKPIPLTTILPSLIATSRIPGDTLPTKPAVAVHARLPAAVRGLGGRPGLGAAPGARAAAEGAWFKKCHFQVTPEIDRALMVKGFLVLGVTLI